MIYMLTIVGFILFIWMVDILYFSPKSDYKAHKMSKNEFKKLKDSYTVKA